MIKTTSEQAKDLENEQYKADRAYWAHVNQCQTCGTVAGRCTTGKLLWQQIESLKEALREVERRNER